MRLLFPLFVASALAQDYLPIPWTPCWGINATGCEQNCKQWKEGILSSTYFDTGEPIISYACSEKTVENKVGQFIKGIGRSGMYCMECYKSQVYTPEFSVEGVDPRSGNGFGTFVYWGNICNFAYYYGIASARASEQLVLERDVPKEYDCRGGDPAPLLAATGTVYRSGAASATSSSASRVSASASGAARSTDAGNQRISFGAAGGPWTVGAAGLGAVIGGVYVWA